MIGINTYPHRYIFRLHPYDEMDALSLTFIIKTVLIKKNSWVCFQSRGFLMVGPPSLFCTLCPIKKFTLVSFRYFHI